MREDPAAPHRSQARGGPLQQGRPRDLILPARGLLFDNDGVLVDSDAAVTTSWSRWALEQDLDPAGVMAVVHGRRSADTVADLVPGERRVAATALIDRYELEDAQTVPAVAGAADLLASLPAAVWAVVTSGTPALATARLTAAGLPLPETMVTGPDVRAGKPDPECYRLGARALGLRPEDTVVLEDSPAGVASGRAAGARVLGIGERALGCGADVVVRDLTGLRWADGLLLVPAAAVLQPT
ncbi:sugar-phosphatase [Geodermatophilus dictyosporus]|uniref:Sugar-phosphatase n=1 Tax=Geodermatophilus dictyosporus TaxID=1523247 RepID=A0A1I5RJ82_9ACTN|nr:HAD-IA family hydrolase [Geodermatophilus dictyosporus]SFP58582.1 sugar-phosphatase [Geodermatophilus dictyosporus]